MMRRELVGEIVGASLVVFLVGAFAFCCYLCATSERAVTQGTFVDLFFEVKDRHSDTESYLRAAERYGDEQDLTDAKQKHATAEKAWGVMYLANEKLKTLESREEIVQVQKQAMAEVMRIYGSQ